ncbi:hypothetical protein KIPB_009976, partial [Kipferlia bialata]
IAHALEERDTAFIGTVSALLEAKHVMDPQRVAPSILNSSKALRLPYTLLGASLVWPEAGERYNPSLHHVAAGETDGVDTIACTLAPGVAIQGVSVAKAHVVLGTPVVRREREAQGRAVAPVDQRDRRGSKGKSDPNSTLVSSSGGGEGETPSHDAADPTQAPPEEAKAPAASPDSARQTDPSSAGEIVRAGAEDSGVAGGAGDTEMLASDVQRTPVAESARPANPPHPPAKPAPHPEGDMSSGKGAAPKSPSVEFVDAPIRGLSVTVGGTRPESIAYCLQIGSIPLSGPTVYNTVEKLLCKVVTSNDLFQVDPLMSAILDCKDNTPSHRVMILAAYIKRLSESRMPLRYTMRDPVLSVLNAFHLSMSQAPKSQHTETTRELVTVFADLLVQLEPLQTSVRGMLGQFLTLSVAGSIVKWPDSLCPKACRVSVARLFFRHGCFTYPPSPSTAARGLTFCTPSMSETDMARLAGQLKDLICCLKDEESVSLGLQAVALFLEWSYTPVGVVEDLLRFFLRHKPFSAVYHRLNVPSAKLVARAARGAVARVYKDPAVYSKMKSDVDIAIAGLPMAVPRY